MLGVGGSIYDDVRSVATSGAVTSRWSDMRPRTQTRPGHPVIRSFEPGEDWFWNYRTSEYTEGPRLAPPDHHPLDQPVPGPAGRVPANWQEILLGS